MFDEGEKQGAVYSRSGKAKNFLVVDLRENFSDLGSGGRKKK